MEGWQAAGNYRRPRDRQPERLSHQQPERFVSHEAAEQVWPLNLHSGRCEIDELPFPEDGVLVAEAPPQRMKAELEANVGRGVDGRPEAVDHLQESHSEGTRHRGRARLLDAARRVSGREF